MDAILSKQSLYNFSVSTFKQFVERTSVALEVTEQKTAENATVTTLNTSTTKRISFIKPVNTPKVSSPFLISKSDLSTGHLSRKSFLNRDSPILEKLAGLSKPGADGDTILNTAKGKGNYVFVATEKKDVSWMGLQFAFGLKIKSIENWSNIEYHFGCIFSELKAEVRTWYECHNGWGN